MVLRGFQLHRHLPRRDGRGDQLRVRMREGGAGLFAVVLEEQDVLEARVSHQVPEPLLIDKEDLLELRRRHVAQVQVVIGAFDDDLMSSDTPHAVVEPHPLASQLPLDHERGVLVGDHAHGPAGGVRRGAIAEGQDLRRCLRLVSVAERAIARRGHLGGRQVEVHGPPAAFGGDDDPASRNRFVSEF